MMELKHWNQALEIHISSLEIFLKNILNETYSVTLEDEQTGTGEGVTGLIEQNNTGIRLKENNSGVELFLVCNENWIKHISDRINNDGTENEGGEDLIVKLFSGFIEITVQALEQTGIEIDISDISKIENDGLPDSHSKEKYFISTLAAKPSPEETDQEEAPALNMGVALTHPDEDQADAFNAVYEDENPFTDGRYEELINILADHVGDMQNSENNPPHDSSISTRGQDVEFEDFGQSENGKESNNARNIDLLGDVDMHVSVELGACDMPLSNILQLVKGSVIELEKMAGEPVEILVNGNKIAQGDVVVVDERFGVRVSSLLTSQKRIKELQ